MALYSSQIGNNGHLGNQMFQYAALRGIAENRGFEWAIPHRDNPSRFNYQLFECFKMSNAEYRQEKFSNKSVYLVDKFEFDENVYNDCPDNIDLHGYFQTERYFSKIKESIRDDFTFNNYYDLPFEEYVCLHIRRGDYLNYPDSHPVCSIEYYSRGLEIVPDLPIVIVSDDINWCRENINADYYSDRQSNIEDLYLMANASHNIIANSSFSWWGAWLNKNPDKIVIAPEKWFGKRYSHYKINDLIPKNWNII